ncbi:methionyl-tRNA formyltransferase [Butyrivibrio hungatei]|uniref:Methionyl-tRNA formyltransferase n=1 Tax=Butyrivibrio hungatei TaxID=185008 RepID=A0A1G5F2N1_9FIRM|nr:methionyl-tRNA formyltransferase [Butyrivibrio hungatei]SCY33505.1 methionyl-tRNA formyltransferase [Butyrivibrio hungatei]
MKIIFMGTPDFAASALEKIVEAGHEITLVVTQPDKPKGRSGELQVSDVKACALKHGFPVFQPERIKLPENVAYLKNYEADIYVVAAFGQILSQEILDIPKFGCVNIHASLLPKYRGAAPIQQAIIDGEKTTGVTIMQMAAGMDTGDILLQREIPIDDNETGGGLFDKLSELGAELIAEALPKIERGELTPVPQDEKLATKCGKLSKNMGKIDFNKSAVTIRNLVRGLNPWPSAYTRLDGKMLKIWSADAIDDKNVKEIAGNVEVLKNAAPGTVSFVTKDAVGVATGKGTLVLKEVQLEGKKRMLVKDFLLGNKVEIGTSFQMR